MPNKRYLIIDAANLFFRTMHVAALRLEPDEGTGFCIHTILTSVNKCWREQKADHVVFCFEGRSWRKSFYPPYKAHRAEARSAQTEKQQEEMRLYFDAFDSFQEYLKTKTTCTVLRHEELEADDLVAGWIEAHPDDHHTIVSSDSDFYQLIAENVVQFNGVTGELITLEGFFDSTGKPVIDKKTKEAKKLEDPSWILFEKIVRGDPTDNVFSAFPGARVKGTKNKIGIYDAYLDRDTKGFNYNNFMLQRWMDHNGEEHRVIDDFARNTTLIDLKAQPSYIKEKIYTTINEQTSSKKEIPMLGAQFLKFCGKHQLIKLSEQASTYVSFLSSTY